MSSSPDQAISTASIVVAAMEQLSCDLEGEAAILNLRDGVYYGLDAVGASVWKLLQEPRAVIEIRDALLEQYEVDPGRCERDLVALLSELAAVGLVQVRDGSDS